MLVISSNINVPTNLYKTKLANLRIASIASELIPGSPLNERYHFDMVFECNKQLKNLEQT